MVGFVRIDRPLNNGSGRGLGGARVVSADGTVRTLPDDFDANKLRAMLAANGGERTQEWTWPGSSLDQPLTRRNARIRTYVRTIAKRIEPGHPNLLK
jgi:hypothetical protein